MLKEYCCLLNDALNINSAAAEIYRMFGETFDVFVNGKPALHIQKKREAIGTLYVYLIADAIATKEEDDSDEE